MTRAAVSSAANAFTKWKKRTARERSNLLYRWFELITDHREALAQLLTLEQGKPLLEAKGEVTYGASFVRWFAEEAPRIYGDLAPASSPNKRTVVLKEPVGVVAAITPWNFPVAMITRKVAPALAAGCTVVVKPSEETPLCALALAELADRAGFPPGVFNVLPTTMVKEVGEVLTTHPSVRKVSFTGSTEVGRLLMRQCAGTLKKLSLELGGNAPFIVFDDADLDAAVAGAVASKYRNAGQTCICANRFYVQRAVYDEFYDKLRREVGKLKVGDGFDAAVKIGPLINKEAVTKVTEMLNEARTEGAVVWTPLSCDLPAGNYLAPTVVTEVSAAMRLVREEIFGPVSPLLPFDREEDAIELANATEAGLAAYFYGKDHARIWRVAEALDYGMVGVNTGAISTAAAPFGGVKQSGFGREGGKYGIEEYLTTKYVCWQVE